MTPTATMLSLPVPAYTEAATRIVSPGAGTPKFSTRISPATARYP